MDTEIRRILNKYTIKMQSPDMGSISTWFIKEKNNFKKQWVIRVPDDLMHALKWLQENE